MTESFVGVYDSSTYIAMSRRNVKILLEHGKDSQEFEEAREELLNLWNNIPDECFTFPEDAGYVTFDGIDLRIEELELEEYVGD